MAKFSGTKDLDIALDGTAVILTMRYATPYEAAIAYEEMATAAKRDSKLNMIVTLGDVLEESGPAA